MRYRFSLSLLFLALFSFPQIQAQTTADTELWLTQIETAKAKAKADGKPIVLVFSGSDWCRPCMNMKRNIFDKAVFTDYAKESVVLMEVDFPRRKENQLTMDQRRHNNSLANKYGIQYFPTMVIVDANGKELDRIGYQSSMRAADYVKFIKHRAER